MRRFEWSGVIGLLALAIIAVVFGIVLYTNARRPGFASSAAYECRAFYQKARNAVDTSLVDVRWPSTGPAKDPQSPTCGMLRRTGQLSH